MTFSTIVKHLFTGKDNETIDIGRVSWAICLIAVIGFAIVQIMKTAFNLMDFAQSVAAVVGVHSAGIWAKKDTEPTSPSDNAPTR